MPSPPSSSLRPQHGTPSPKAALDHGPRTKLLSWACLTVVQILAATVLKAAQHNGTYAFSPQSSLVLSESIKCLLSLGYLVQTSTSITAARRALAEESEPRLVGHMLGLAGIYCVNNGLMFWLFARADPGSITLIKSGGTIVSAVLMYLWRDFRLSGVRWAVILVQMLGLIVAQYDMCLGKSQLAGGVYVVLFVSLFNSSVANVWNEHVVKRFEKSSLATKNVHLYMFGAGLNVMMFAYRRVSEPGSPGFFDGYGVGAMLVVSCNAFMGIAINIVYKYADALVKNIATTSTTVVLLIISGWFFEGRADVMVFVGAGVVLLGTFLYFVLGLEEEKLKEMKVLLEREDVRVGEYAAFVS